jgi:phosphatidylserine decarboxylase
LAQGPDEGSGREAGRRPLHPVVEELRALVDGDPIVRMDFTQMIEQAPHTKKYRKRHLKSVDQMLRLIDAVIGRAPEYNETGLVGVPPNAVLDWCMGTPAGFSAFRHEAINGMFRKILRGWCDFLSSPASLHALNDSPRGWKCASARESTQIEQFQHDPRDEHRGFTSWNDSFIRRFKPDRRPIADPDDEVIVSACESTPYEIRTGAKRQDRSGSRRSPVRSGTCSPATHRSRSRRSSAARCTRRASTPTTITAGTARSRAR